MKARIVELCLLLTALLLFPSAVAAQAPNPPTLAENVAKLAEAVGKLSEQMVTKDDLTDLVTKAELRSEVGALTDLIVEQDAEIAKLKTDFNVVTDQLHSQVAEQGQILNAISRQDSQGNHVLALKSNMDKSPELKKEVAVAVNDSIRRRGTLRIENRMTGDRYLRVNHRDYRIPAMSTRNIKVPVGTVTTELVGYEAPKHLTVSPPKYLEKLIIAPTSRAAVVVGPPVIIDYPFYGPSIAYGPPIYIR